MHVSAVADENIDISILGNAPSNLSRLFSLDRALITPRQNNEICCYDPALYVPGIQAKNCV